ncbi:hypothetical protein BDR26DRAFT_873639 [Obelidium mucronatum]|nr:hypothetical protein BDR26DRAFT_873639 [Obelidium mucronatum]
MIEFGKKRYNLAILKKRAYSHVPVKVTKNFKTILTSPEFDAFLLCAAHYIRWFIQVVHLQKTNQIAFVPPPATRNAASKNKPAGDAPGSAWKNPLAATSTRRMSMRPIFVEDGGDTVEMEIAVETRDEKLKELASAYCFLLLLTSRATTEPARERAYFESIYAFTKEISIQLISLPNYNQTLETELNRLFRGELFSGTNAQDSFKTTTTAKKRVSIVAVSKDLWGAHGAAGAHGTANAANNTAAGGAGGVAAAGIAGGASAASRPASGGAFSQLMGVSGAARPASAALSLTGNVTNTVSGMGGLGGLAALLQGGGGGGAGGMVNKFKAKASILGKLSNLSKPKVDIFGKDAVPVGGDLVENATGAAEKQSIAAKPTAALPPIKKEIATGNQKSRKRISLGEIRMARSPLANAILPPPQRFLFT